MRRLSLSVMSAFVLLVVGACDSPTESARDVSLTIGRLAASRGGRSLLYEYTIANASAASVWIPACDGVIRPDVAVMIGGHRADTYRGSLCQTNVYMGPALIAPGASYRGASSVETASGATFVPSVAVSLSPTNRAPGRRVSGAQFAAP